MVKTAAEREMIAQFEQSYRRARSPVIQMIERSVCGCDYGGTSWTTREEAVRVGEALALAPGKTLLEVGAGSGWPGLYLAKLSGCTSVLVDLPLEGLRVAVQRARSDGLSGRCFVAQADGAALPFKGESFDAVSHSDVLCCLPDKTGVLRECRRAIRDTGRMAFTVIFAAKNLSPGDYEDAVAAGPPFVEAEADYETLLKRAGWRLTSRADLTVAFVNSTRRISESREAHSGALAELLGADECRDLLARTRANLSAIDRQLLERAMFVAEPA